MKACRPTRCVGAPSRAPLPAPAPEVEGAVDQLVAMGFSKTKAKEALGECDGDAAAAVEWLFANCL